MARRGKEHFDIPQTSRDHRDFVTASSEVLVRARACVHRYAYVCAALFLYVSSSGGCVPQSTADRTVGVELYAAGEATTD